MNLLITTFLVASVLVIAQMDAFDFEEYEKIRAETEKRAQKLRLDYGGDSRFLLDADDRFFGEEVDPESPTTTLKPKGVFDRIKSIFIADKNPETRTLLDEKEIIEVDPESPTTTLEPPTTTLDPESRRLLDEEILDEKVKLKVKEEIYPKMEYTFWFVVKQLAEVKNSEFRKELAMEYSRLSYMDFGDEESEGYSEGTFYSILIYMTEALRKEVFRREGIRERIEDPSFVKRNYHKIIDYIEKGIEKGGNFVSNMIKKGWNGMKKYGKREAIDLPEIDKSNPNPELRNNERFIVKQLADMKNAEFREEMVIMSARKWCSMLIGCLNSMPHEDSFRAMVEEERQLVFKQEKIDNWFMPDDKKNLII